MENHQPKRPVKALTTEDWLTLKAALLRQVMDTVAAETQRILQAHTVSFLQKKLIKPAELKQVLPLSRGKIRELRQSGALPYCKIGGSILYDYDDVLKLIGQSRRQDTVANAKRNRNDGAKS